MKVLLSGGGTGGHVYPAIAIANKIKEENPDCEILFVGTEKGIESEIVPKYGYELKTAGLFEAYGFFVEVFLFTELPLINQNKIPHSSEWLPQTRRPYCNVIALSPEACLQSTETYNKEYEAQASMSITN